MNEKKTVSYDKNGGPIVLEIKAKYATLGSYSAMYSVSGNLVPLGDGKLGDNIPDVYLLPVPVANLSNYTVFIAGTYVPSPGHSQISVEYNFLQDGKALKGENPVVIEINQDALSTTHTIHFKAE